MYKSPLHILSGWNEDPSLISAPGYLLRLRKELLAEFNLNNSTTLEIGSATYSKDDIIKTIDQLLDNPNLSLHTFIFADKNLLSFLEDDNSGIRADFIKTLVIPEELSASLPPLITERLAYKLKKAFFTRNFFQVKEVVSSWPQVDEESTLQFYDLIHRNVVTIISEIETLPSYNIAEMPEELPYLKKKEVSVFFNSLPEDFATTRDSFVSAVTNCLVAYQNSYIGHDKNYNYCVSQMLVEVKCSEHLEELVRKNHEVFSKNFTGSGSSGEWSVGRIGYFIIIAIIALSRLSTCNQSSSSYSAPVITSYSSPGNTYDPSTSISQYTTTDLNLQPEKSIPVVEAPENTTEVEPEQVQEIEISFGARTFMKYRAAIINYKGNLCEFYGQKLPVATTASLSGESPFQYFLNYKADKQQDLKKMLINNRTHYQLILVAISPGDQRAAFFFRNKQDTFTFSPTAKLYFYFGDSLIKNRMIYTDGHSGEALTAENYFKKTDEAALNIFSKTYQLQLKSIKTLPTLEITNSFFKKEKIETQNIELTVVDSLSSP